MLNVIAWIILISSIPVAVGFAITKLPSYKKALMWFFISFAAGVMLGNTFFDLLPESLELSGNSSILGLVLVGIVFFFLMEKFLLWHSHEHGEGVIKNSTILIMIGDTLHNFIDGIIIAGAFLVSPITGITTSLAVILHEIPQEVGDFSILVQNGIKPKRAVIFNFISGLAAVAGGVFGYTFLTVATNLIPFCTAFAGGMFIYIACSDLIPRTHEWDKKRFETQTAPSFLLGIIIIKLLSTILN